MAKHTTLSSLFTATADAIRAKKGTTDPIIADNFPDEITALPDVEPAETETWEFTLEDDSIVTKEVQLVVDDEGSSGDGGNGVIFGEFVVPDTATTTTGFVIENINIPSDYSMQGFSIINNDRSCSDEWVAQLLYRNADLALTSQYAICYVDPDNDITEWFCLYYECSYNSISQTLTLECTDSEIINASKNCTYKYMIWYGK